MCRGGGGATGSHCLELHLSLERWWGGAFSQLERVCVCSLRIDGGGAGVWRSGSCSFNEPPSFKTKPKKKTRRDRHGTVWDTTGLNCSCANLCREFKKKKKKPQ